MRSNAAPRKVWRNREPEGDGRPADEESPSEGRDRSGDSRRRRPGVTAHSVLAFNEQLGASRKWAWCCWWAVCSLALVPLSRGGLCPFALVIRPVAVLGLLGAREPLSARPYFMVRHSRRRVTVLFGLRYHSRYADDLARRLSGFITVMIALRIVVAVTWHVGHAADESLLAQKRPTPAQGDAY